MSDLLALKGRTAFVTGAGQGVGRRIALHFAEHGAGAVVINDYRLDRAEAVAAEIEAAGAKALAIAGDVSDLESVNDAVAQSLQMFGSIDILVNNAGNAGPNPTDEMTRPFWEQTPTEWHGYLGTNLYGPLNVCHAVAPAMIEHGYGRIVNMISDAARFGEPGRETYAAGKAGTAGFTRSLAASLGRFGITANCVSLAATRTPRTEKGMENEAAVKKMMSRYIIRRPGEVDDAANMVLMLASDASSWVTGQTIPVNGGYSFAL
ncbi:oxidoreductase [Rhodococcus sp. Leaf278]|uniref:SDR family NAD(P)-dependent oxidoreductase n=1 Tax=Rhodococcus sp. Leaf278 TaxID=1736319 RepID=UPI00070DF831|nr:SDR family NAD(P)-dependent oxidoreductase [Rhodococcus sp. Leaf278]KQU56727.1 oxidoreductase [Rhodococcus sp. Leaf278]